jgi:hypothetical protein
MSDQQVERVRFAQRHPFTVVVRDGEYSDAIGGQPGETVEQVVARRFAHCGGRLPEGWTIEVHYSKQ